MRTSFASTAGPTAIANIVHRTVYCFDFTYMQVVFVCSTGLLTKWQSKGVSWVGLSENHHIYWMQSLEFTSKKNPSTTNVNWKYWYLQAAFCTIDKKLWYALWFSCLWCVWCVRKYEVFYYHMKMVDHRLFAQFPICSSFFYGIPFSKWTHTNDSQ